jgi:FkbM family methyltransferase
MEIFYGTYDKNINVTNICKNMLLNNSIITIPAHDNNRARYFSDPCYGTLKKILILINKEIFEFNTNFVVYINLLTNTISHKYYCDIDEKISLIHKNIRITCGSMLDELPEQKMVAMYLDGSEKVLEIGSNIGRNTMIIAYILNKNNNNNFVTLECNKDYFEILKENKNINNLNFNIEYSALSKKRLMQHFWTTIPIETYIPPGWNEVNTITLEDLHKKYNIEFNTLVLDCEGAFYNILLDYPNILNTVNLIIVENDYFDVRQKEYVDNKLRENNFYCDYVNELISDENNPVCKKNFFEVWKRKYLL